LFNFFGGSLLLSSPSIAAITESGSSIVPVPGIVDNLLFVLGMIIIFVPFQLCALDSWQRLSAWNKTDKSLNKVLLYPTFLLVLIYCIPILVGIVIRNQGISVSLDSHPLKLFLESIALPPILLGLVITGFISAIFTTADELLNCSSLSLLFDTFLIPRQANRTAHEEKKIVLGGKIYTSIFAFIAALIALLALKFDRRISELALAIFSTQVIFTFPLFIALFRKDTAPKLAKTAIVAMLLSFIVAVGAVLTGWIVKDKQLSDAAPVLAFSIALLTFGITIVISSIRSKLTKNREINSDGSSN
jgi:Na+/proline symporter